MARSKLPIVIENIQLTGMADKGYSVGRDAGGRVVFVEGAVPGDVADVLVYKRKKGVLFGQLQRLVSPSPDRVSPFCRHFAYCGGCKWQHLSYEAQLREKTRVVRDAIERIGKIEVGEFLPILGAPETTFYRNKLEFGCSNRRWMTQEELVQDVSNEVDVIGFHRAGVYDKILEIEECWLQGGGSNELRNGIAELARRMGIPFFDARERSGLLRQLMIRTSSLGETMVLVAFFENRPNQIQPFLDAIKEAFPTITSLIYCINPKLNEFLMDLDMVLHSGPGHIEEVLGDVRFRIGPKSFFQTNTAQARRLYDTALDFAGLSGTENVYDLYTGIGSIALYAADRCRQVVGIEEIAAAIEDARNNAERNNITNARFHAGDVKDILTPAFAEEHGRPDLLITDPPRAGMHPKVIDMLLELAPPRIVYVSCNPATQARDLQLLSGKYRVDRLRPVDMFPHTSHIETVALLNLSGL